MSRELFNLSVTINEHARMRNLNDKGAIFERLKSVKGL
jgi:hypothetical protein